MTPSVQQVSLATEFAQSTIQTLATTPTIAVQVISLPVAGQYTWSGPCWWYLHAGSLCVPEDQRILTAPCVGWRTGGELTLGNMGREGTHLVCLTALYQLPATPPPPYTVRVLGEPDTAGIALKRWSLWTLQPAPYRTVDVELLQITDAAPLFGDQSQGTRVIVVLRGAGSIYADGHTIGSIQAGSYLVSTPATTIDITGERVTLLDIVIQH